MRSTIPATNPTEAVIHIRRGAFCLGLLLNCALSCAAKTESSQLLSCNDRAQEAYSRINTAAQSAGKGCQVDLDCAYFVLYSDCCIYLCGGTVPVSDAGATELKNVIDNVNASTCSLNVGQCVCELPPCIADMNGVRTVPICANGQCASLPEESWNSFVILRNSQNDGEVSIAPGTIPNCGTSKECTGWYLSSEKSITIMDASVDAGTRSYLVETISDTDFSTVDAILRGESFRRSELGDLHCGAAPSGTIVEFGVQRDKVDNVDVSGCILTGPSDTEAQRLYEIITKY